MIVIFDIDGTLANVDDLIGCWHADPEEFLKRVGEAKIVDSMRKLYQIIDRSNTELVVYTARPEKTRIATEKWLKEKSISYNELLMAKDNDPRHDVDVKLEMLRENGLTPDKVAFIVDDRTCIVQALRKEGYTVLQCADGDY